MDSHQEMILQGKKFVPYLFEDAIKSRVAELAEVINTVHADTHPLFIVVLKGAFVFASDLLRKVNIACDITFVRLKSYEGTQSTGVIEKVPGLNLKVEGRNVVIIEDIVDTGTTLTHFIKQLNKDKPTKIHVAALLHKPEAIISPIKIDYLGFSIPNLFVVGYGLDYEETGRNLPNIYHEKS